MRQSASLDSTASSPATTGDRSTSADAGNILAAIIGDMIVVTVDDVIEIIDTLEANGFVIVRKTTGAA